MLKPKHFHHLRGLLWETKDLLPTTVTICFILPKGHSSVMKQERFSKYLLPAGLYFLGNKTSLEVFILNEVYYVGTMVHSNVIVFHIVNWQTQSYLILPPVINYFHYVCHYPPDYFLLATSVKCPSLSPPKFVNRSINLVF